MTVYFINWKADYEIKMIDYLNKYYKTSGVSVPSQYVWMAKKFKKIGIKTNWFGRKFIRKYLNGIQLDDIAVFNDSVIMKGITPQILNELKCRKVLLLRNSVDRNFIDEHIDSFDLIYDFEHKESNAKKVKYLEQFFPVGINDIHQLSTGKKKHEKTVCYFLGRDKKRLSAITELAENLLGYNVILDFNIVKDKDSQGNSAYFIDNPFSYNENLKRSLAADIIVDITQEYQSGWTLRILEALYFNKKIITNNKKVLDSEIYSKERFFVLGHDKWSSFEFFMDADILPVTESVLYKYSPDFMLETIIKEFETR